MPTLPFFVSRANGNTILIKIINKLKIDCKTVQNKVFLNQTNLG